MDRKPWENKFCSGKLTVSICMLHLWWAQSLDRINSWVAWKSTNIKYCGETRGQRYELSYYIVVFHYTANDPLYWFYVLHDKTSKKVYQFTLDVPKWHVFLSLYYLSITSFTPWLEWSRYTFSIDISLKYHWHKCLLTRFVTL